MKKASAAKLQTSAASSTADGTGMSFVVYGTPRPQGSMRGFVRNGRAHLTSDNRNLKPYRQEVAQTAMLSRPKLLSGPVFVRLRFYFAKPKSYPASRTEHTVKPDVDKLIRAVFDAVKGICWLDDAQAVDAGGRKFYGLPERTEVEIMPLSNAAEFKTGDPR